MADADSASLSSVEAAPNSKVLLDDFDDKWKEILKNGLKNLKRQNRKVKKMIVKGKAHQSATVAAHTNVVSCQLQDMAGNYLGSAHIDEEGKLYPNSKWEKSLSEE